MSYEPGQENYSEFIAAWNTSNQTNLPTKITGGEALNYNFTWQVQSIKKQGEATLSSSQVDTNSNPALWTGDIRTYAGSISFNMFTLEFENNQLIRNAALQDQRAGFADDMCYAISAQAKMKMNILYRCGGTTYGAYAMSPYVRIIGVLVEQ